MLSKDVLVNSFKTNYDTALKFVNQNNLPEAKNCFKKSLESAIKLIECTFSGEKESYKAKAMNIAQLIERIDAKIAEAGNKPAGGNGSTGGAKGDKPGEAAKKTETPPPPPISVEEAFEKLNSLTGLSKVKEEVNTLVAELRAQKMRESRGMHTSNTNRHLVFAGSPGTGKTTVARIMADIYRALGVLEKGHLVEVAREDLVAGYVGQTGPKTQEKINEAMGGVLFIDEVYRLAEGGQNDFGQEAVGALLKAIEDYRDKFIVVIAGYERNMEDFMKMNPGLASRFPNYIHFEDYTGSEMFKIFEGMCKKDEYQFGDEVRDFLKNKFDSMYENRGSDFGNARDVRNFFERAKKKQNVRVSRIGASISDEDLITLTLADVSD